MSDADPSFSSVSISDHKICKAFIKVYDVGVENTFIRIAEDMGLCYTIRFRIINIYVLPDKVCHLRIPEAFKKP